MIVYFFNHQAVNKVIAAIPVNPNAIVFHLFFFDSLFSCTSLLWNNFRSLMSSSALQVSCSARFSLISSLRLLSTSALAMLCSSGFSSKSSLRLMSTSSLVVLFSSGFSLKSSRRLMPTSALAVFSRFL